jgi:hypothetical protein
LARKGLYGEGSEERKVSGVRGADGPAPIAATGGEGIAEEEGRLAAALLQRFDDGAGDEEAEGGIG